MMAILVIWLFQSSSVIELEWLGKACLLKGMVSGQGFWNAQSLHDDTG
jgi:hypothetical protein